jgi:hypothetical protein
VSPRSGTPIPEGEHDQRVKGLLDRAGETGAKCQQKRYGSGWVTVCE